MRSASFAHLPTVFFSRGPPLVELVESWALASAKRPETSCEMEPMMPKTTIKMRMERISAKLFVYGYGDMAGDKGRKWGRCSESVGLALGRGLTATDLARVAESNGTLPVQSTTPP